MRDHQTFRTSGDAGDWTADTASILFMLNCYDVWSATPDRICFTDGDCARRTANNPT